MCGNSDRSLQTSDNSLIIVENFVLGVLIVTSTMPLEREILASLRTLEASGLFVLDRVSENCLIVTTSVLIVASPAHLFDLRLDEFCEGVEVHEFHLQALIDGVVSGQNLAHRFWDANSAPLGCQVCVTPHCNISLDP